MLRAACCLARCDQIRKAGYSDPIRTGPGSVPERPPVGGAGATVARTFAVPARRPALPVRHSPRAALGHLRAAPGTRAGMWPSCWELFANSLQHSRSGAPGETVTIAVKTGNDAIRVEVTDLSTRGTSTTQASGCLLIRRRRLIVDRWVWELPGGGYVHDGEDPAAAAREVEEETGWRPRDKDATAWQEDLTMSWAPTR